MDASIRPANRGATDNDLLANFCAILSIEEMVGSLHGTRYGCGASSMP